MGSLRPALLAAVIAALVAPGAAYARHSYSASYSGTVSSGGTVSFNVNADGTAVTNSGFRFMDVPTACGTVNGTTGSDTITNHTFSRGTIGQIGTAYNGSFPDFQQASGQLSYRQGFPACQSTLTWTASTTAALPPQCNDGVDNDNDGQTDYPADFSCLAASDNDEAADHTPPVTPSISETVPGTPSNDNTPQVKGGGAEAGSTVKVYGDQSCSGPVLGSGSGDDFNGVPGVTATVPADQETPLRVTATDAAGNASSCSAPFMYTHDSIPPPTPTIEGTQPSSPANSTALSVRGTVGAPATVRIYMDQNCTGPEIGSGNDGEFGGGGIGVNVPPNSTTFLRGTATDTAGNVSACSAPFAYTSDSQPPETTITGGPSGPTSDNTPTFEFNSSEPGSSFTCGMDLAPPFGCMPPFTAAPLALGAHTFSVFATDAVGNSDPGPASRPFSVTTSEPPPANGNGGDDTTISLAASAPTPQRALKQKGLVAFAACSGEPCSARATGYVDIPPAGAAAAKRFSLISIQKALAANQRAKLKLRCSTRLLKQIRAALADRSRRKRVRAVLKVRATDAAANSRTVSMNVKIRR